MVTDTRLTLVLAADVRVAVDDTRRAADEWRQGHQGAAVVEAPPAVEWPFRFPLIPPLAAGPLVVSAAAVHKAFVNHQTGATRLVTTQAMYLFEEWQAALAAHGQAHLVAWGDLESVRTHAPEILARRGVFGRSEFELRIVEENEPGAGSREPGTAQAEGTIGVATLAR